MDINICILYNIYGNMLTDKQKEIMDLHFMYDNSLSEIAEKLNITRQTARDSIVSSTKVLEKFENKLGIKTLLFSAVEKTKELKSQIMLFAKEQFQLGDNEQTQQIIGKINNIEHLLEG